MCLCLDETDCIRNPTKFRCGQTCQAHSPHMLTLNGVFCCCKGCSVRAFARDCAVIKRSLSFSSHLLYDQFSILLQYVTSTPHYLVLVDSHFDASGTPYHYVPQEDLQIVHSNIQVGTHSVACPRWVCGTWLRTIHAYTFVRCQSVGREHSL